MKVRILTVLCMMSSLLMAQDSTMLSPFQGSWEVVETTVLAANTDVAHATNFDGHQLHILNNGYLALKSERGVYLTPFQQHDDIITYGITKLKMVVNTPDSVQLQYLNKETARYLLLSLVPAAGLGSEQARYEGMVSWTHLGDFRMGGYYYRYDEEQGEYTYLRFLPRDRMLRKVSNQSPIGLYDLDGAFAKQIWPIQIDKVDEAGNLHPAYYSTEKWSRSFELTKTGDLTERYSYRSFNSREDKVDVNTYTFLADEQAYWLPSPRAEVGSEESQPYQDLLLTGPVVTRSAAVDTEVYRVVDKMPRFPGCEDINDESERKTCAQQELLKFVYKNLKYPTEAREAKIEGVSVITFVVEADGRVTNPVIVRGVGGGCDEAALNVVQLMQEKDIRWIPGTQRGTPVHVQFNLPVKFALR